eukprot:1325069-Pyramimonas_sp.AAC.1
MVTDLQFLPATGCTGEIITTIYAKQLRSVGCPLWDEARSGLDGARKHFVTYVQISDSGPDQIGHHKILAKQLATTS